MWYSNWNMSLEQTGETGSEFQSKQKELLDSAHEHITKMSMAGFATVAVMMVNVPIGVIGTLEVLHQIVAATVDLRKRELNKRKHNTSTNTNSTSQ